MLIYCAVGYFIYDIVAMSAHGLLDLAMTAHHSVAIIGMTLCLTHDTTANVIVMAIFVAESSNPPMHLRNILKHYGLRHTKSYEFLEISFLLIYVLNRSINGIQLTYLVYTCSQNPKAAVAGALIL